MADTAVRQEAINVTVDGREVAAEPGELIIDAAERAGVYIPRFCYHPRMKPVGMCRMCLVEVSGQRGPSLQPACFVEVVEGQEVNTESPAARKAQEGVLEFLLINHPLDCPVCDKGGECPLQDQAMSRGPGESRFVEEKRHFAKPISLGPLTLLDRERCIQCARCTRFQEEIAGEPQIDFLSRGDMIEVAVFPDQPFDSYFAGNTVQICPVGALTSAPYRFRSRPWDMEQVESTCTFCAVGCRVAVQSSAGQVVRLMGIDSDPVNQSWLCDRGRYGFEAVHSESRIRQPFVRRDRGLEPVSWNDALRELTAAIRQAKSSQGPSSVGIIGGARLANEDQYAWSKLARTVIGTDNVDAQLGDGLPAELVCSLPAATIDDACNAKAVILFCGDLHEELPVLHLRLRTAAVKGGLRILDCSPVATVLSAVAAATLPARPGESSRLAEALAPGSGIHVAGVDPLALSKAHDLLAGLSGEDIVVVIGRPSPAERAEDTAAAAARLVSAFPGVRFLAALRRSNVRGAIDMGLAPAMLPGRVSLADGRDWFESQWGELPTTPGLDTRGMLEAAVAGTLQTLVLLGADPLSDFPDRSLAARALEEVPFLVAIETVPSASGRLADVVLPAAGFAERGGTTTNLEGRVTHLTQKVVPPGTARPDWVIAVEVAERLGFDLGFESLEGIWEEIEQVAPAHRGVTVEAVYGEAGQDGVVLPVKARAVGLPGRRRRLDPMATPGIQAVNLQGAPLFAGSAVLETGEGERRLVVDEPEKTELPAEAGEEPERPAARPGPVAFAPDRWQTPARPVEDAESLRLVLRRSLYDRGSLLEASPSLAPLVPAQQLRLPLEEIDRLGLSEGEEVRVRSGRGELVAPVRRDASLPPGVAVLSHNVQGEEEGGANLLVDADEPCQTVRLESVGG